MATASSGFLVDIDRAFADLGTAGGSMGFDQSEACAESGTADPEFDAAALDIAVYLGQHYCDTDDPFFVVNTYDNWTSDELAFYAVHIDVDGNLQNGCDGGDYLALAFYDQGLFAGLVQTPDCETSDFVGEVFIDRARAASWLPSTPAATSPRSSTAPTSCRSCRHCRAAEPQRCSVSSATQR